MDFETKVKYAPRQINNCFVEALVELVNACRALDVNIEKVQTYLNGWRIQFENFDGDAVCHEGSYGNVTKEWETIGFPWDYDDVSTHTASELAFYLACLKEGLSPWER